MKENYTYPAILDYSDEGYINISFPDFPGAFSCVEAGEAFVPEAQDVLALAIQDMLDRNITLPDEGSIPEINEDQKLVFINIWMPYFRKKIKEVYVKKTLTIPSWLDLLAKEAQLSFSSVLVEGLKAKLGLKAE